MTIEVKTIITALDGVNIHIQGYYPLPIGSIVELGNPNRNLIVEKVRLRVHGEEGPIVLILNCVKT